MYGVTLIHPQRVAIYTERVAVAAGLGVLANNNLRFHHRNKGAYGKTATNLSNTTHVRTLSL
jgi:hypothetical protein